MRFGDALHSSGYNVNYLEVGGPVGDLPLGRNPLLTAARLAHPLALWLCAGYGCAVSSRQLHRQQSGTRSDPPTQPLASWAVSRLASERSFVHILRTRPSKHYVNGRAGLSLQCHCCCAGRAEAVGLEFSRCLRCFK